LLVDEGVLEAYRGKGVFLKDSTLAWELTSDFQRESSPSGEPTDLISPFSISYAPRTLRIALVSKSVWENVIQEFNESSSKIKVKPVFYSPHDTSASLTMDSDLVQIQSHLRDRLPTAFEALNLNGLLGSEVEKSFFPTLFPTDAAPTQPGFTGLPITAVAHCIAINDCANKKLFQNTPNAWNSFDEYIDFIKRVKGQRPKAVKSVIQTPHNVLFPFVLSGLLSCNRIEGLPNFSDPATRSFLERFGEIYCDPDCYTGEWVSPPINSSTETLLREVHTYELRMPPHSLNDPAAFISLPTEGQGHVPIISHLICVNAQGKAQEDAVEFLKHLASDAVMKLFNQAGRISGRQDASNSMHTPIRHTLETGQLLEHEFSNALASFASRVTPDISSWQRGEKTLEALIETLEKERLKEINLHPSQAYVISTAS